MKKIINPLIFLFLVVVAQACIVSGPKFTRVEKVLTLKTGMTKNEVDKHLGIEPYDLNFYDSSGNYSVIYKYRVTDRKTLPFLLKDTNGVKSRGKYMDLIAYYDINDVAYRLESRKTDSKLKETKVNINSIITAITVTLPAVLVYLGITKIQ